MGITVLIVDDEDPVRMMAKKILQQFKYETLEAKDGQHGLEVAAENECDLVLSDMKMPNMNGLDMAQELLAIDPDRPVVIMTAYGDLDSARRALKMGVYDYIEKPFNIDDLCASIERAAAYRQLTLEVKAYQRDLERKVKERTAELRYKVHELEARDSILRDLLASVSPKEVLQNALAKTLELSLSDVAILYEYENNTPAVIAQYGLPENTTIPNMSSPFYTLIKNVYHSGDPFWITTLDAFRVGLNLSSIALLPITRGNEVIAVLEIGKSANDMLLGEHTVLLLKDFMHYVAMALHECHLEQEMPHWEDNVENLLDISEQWSNLKS